MIAREDYQDNRDNIFGIFSILTKKKLARLISHAHFGCRKKVFDHVLFSFQLKNLFQICVNVFQYTCIEYCGFPKNMLKKHNRTPSFYNNPIPQLRLPNKMSPTCPSQLVVWSSSEAFFLIDIRAFSSTGTKTWRNSTYLDRRDNLINVMYNVYLN